MNPDVELSSQANVDPLGPVFISYRQSDGTDIAVALAWSLRAAGVPVWHDQTDLPPGDTATRLREALASGLSGAILVVTPDISMSDVVRNIELPALLELSHHPSFTLSIVSTVTKDSTSDELDYSAPDRLLGTAPGTLAAINQKPVRSASARFDVAQAQARRRLEHLRPVIAAGGNELLLDVQSRVPPFAATYDAHLVMRLRPPAAGQRRPSRAALEDLRGFLGYLPQLIAIGGATSLNVRGGAHLSIACAIGASVPTTLLGIVSVVDTAGNRWDLDGQPPVEGERQVVAPVEPIAHRRERGPVLVYADLLPQRSDLAFSDLVEDSDFAGVAHLRPVDDGLLDPISAAHIVGELTSAMRELAGHHRTTEVHLLLRCPYPIAVLLGRSLNTLTVHLYEWEDSDEADHCGPRYVPSLVLRSGAGGSSIHRVSAPPTPPTTEATWMATLRSQFSDALSNIEVNGEKRQRAIDAHTEIQTVLAEDEQLREWGINTRLIGSYSRHTARYPGKDVDVFARFEALDTSAMPRTIYERVQAVLVDEYGLVADGGRATPQDRSIKVDFPDPDDADVNQAFAVDAVPAVRDGDRWAIPTKDRKRWAESTGRWVTTNPERFGDLSSDLSTSASSPAVAGQNAYKPIVKLMRQARHVHLGDRRPGGLFVEFAVYDVWSSGLVSGDDWDPLFARTLRAVANRFNMAPLVPIVDPGIGTAVAPALDDDVWTHAGAVFASLADLADEAIEAEKCAAAAKWREILGENERGQVFPLPAGCDARGFPISAIAPVAGLGANEARKFG